MPIQVACPSCSQELRVPDNLIGELVKCPKCESTFAAIAEPSSPPPRVQQSQPTESVRQDQPREGPPIPRPPRPDDDDGHSDAPRRARRDYAPHRGTLILVLGILSLTGLGILTGIPAWIMGSGDLKQIRAGVMDPEGESNTNIGRILGMVSTLIFVVLMIPGCFCCMLGPLAHR
jgi:predicted Zn finger-like uncharacterized protein